MEVTPKKNRGKKVSKILPLKADHSMLSHTEQNRQRFTQPRYEVGMPDETLTHWVSSAFTAASAAVNLMPKELSSWKISHVLKKYILCPFNVSTEEFILGEQTMKTSRLLR